jgi:ribonuclease HI
LGIGDGNSVNIWGDRWIPRASSYKIQTQIQGLTSEAKVSALIDQDTASWNKQLIRDLVSKEEMEAICLLPLSRYKQRDVLCWRSTSTGEFSVRSAYHLEVERVNREKGEGSNSQGNSKIWRLIWRLRIPNTTKTFLWKACSNILPTKQNLEKRRVVDNDGCNLCNGEIESVVHALWTCPAAQDVWGICDMRIQKSQSLGRDFQSVFADLAERCSMEEIEMCAVIARAIWTRRNAVVHGEAFEHPNVLLRKARESLRQFQSMQIESNTGEEAPGTGITQKWTGPPNGSYKVNWDIALDAKQNCLGIGVIIRDDKGAVFGALRRVACTTQDPTMGEAIGALAAVEFSRDTGISDVILEGDSKQIVDAIAGMGSYWCKYGHIIGDINEVMKGFRRWEVRHVRREANEATHVLAKSAIRTKEEKIWLEETPSIIIDVVNQEQAALSV